MAVRSKEDNGKVPLLRERPIINYTKRYDQVSWHSADTDFEPGLSSADEIGKKHQKKAKTTSRRKQKLAALVVVVLIFLGVMCGLLYLYVARSDDYVEIPCGKVSGKLESSTYVYKGIPYALPPINKLRWKPPVATPSGYCGEDILKVHSFKSSCAGNVKGIGSEDCLFLNVYTPTAPNTKAVGKPVIVFFHTDYSGQLSHHNKVQNLVKGFSESMEVVVVTVNNRVGAFGFLTIKELWKTNSSYGNYGIQDQLLAIKWVENNIEKFGGDKKSVTILGGTSTFALLSVQESRKVNFHRAIAMSGSPHLNTTYQEAAKTNREFLVNSKCKSLENEQLVECLYELTTENVQEIFQWNFTTRWDFPEKGVFENALLVCDPIVLKYSLVKAGQNNNKVKMPLIIGNTAQEIGANPSKRFDNQTLDDYKKYLSDRLQGFSQDVSILDKYYGEIMSNSTAEYIHETVTSDVRVICPTNQLKKELTDNPHYVVYRYLFQNIGQKQTHSVNGLDLISLLTTSPPSDSKYIAGEILRKNFKHFIEFGHPIELGWDTTNTASLNGEQIAILEGNYHEEQCSFWNSPKNGFIPYAWNN